MRIILLYLILSTVQIFSLSEHQLIRNDAGDEATFVMQGFNNPLNDFSSCFPEYSSWIRQLKHGNRSDEIVRIKTDSCGNVYTAGNSDSTVINKIDFLIIKYGPGGDTLWIRKYNGTDTLGIRDDYVTDMTIDPAGNVYVTGKSMNVYGNFDYATVKFSTDGILQWVRRFNASYNDIDIPAAIAVDNSGNVFVTGQSRFSSTNYQYVTIKYSSNGDSLWLRNYDGEGNPSVAAGLCLDNSGNCYVSGYSGRFGQANNLVTIKYNSSGTVQWTKMYNGNGANTQEILSAMQTDTSGNIYLAGYSNMSSANQDYLTVKYDKNGNFQWASTYNGTGNLDDYPLSLTIDLTGNVVVTGYSYGPGSNNYDVATVKYNSAGVQQWVQRLNGQGNYIDAGRDVKTDNSGNVYVAGSVYFGNYSDAAVIKYSPSGVQTGIRKFNGTVDRDDIYRCLTIDKSGNIVAAGYTKYNNFDYYALTSKYRQNEFGSSLKLTAVIEGFHYSSSTPFMRSDSVKVYLRNSLSPYNIIDSSKQKLSNTGNAEFFFANAIGGINYLISVTHRNSIETWSKPGSWIVFSQDTASYNFITDASRAYGDNQKQVNLSPVRYAFYGGDINQDGTLDASDLSSVENAAQDGLSGYIKSDVTGDDYVDAADLSLVENNVTSGVNAVIP